MINAKENPDVVVEWTIKSNIMYSIIGIGDKYTTSGMDSITYRWYGAGDFGIDCRYDKGDVIKMQLNIPERILRFYKNGVLSNKIVKDINVSKEYHLIIKIHSTDAAIKDSVYLIDFNIKGHKSLSFHNK